MSHILSCAQVWRRSTFLWFLREIMPTISWEYHSNRPSTDFLRWSHFTCSFLEANVPRMPSSGFSLSFSRNYLSCGMHKFSWMRLFSRKVLLTTNFQWPRGDYVCTFYYDAFLPSSTFGVDEMLRIFADKLGMSIEESVAIMGLYLSYYKEL